MEGSAKGGSWRRPLRVGHGGVRSGTRGGLGQSEVIWEVDETFAELSACARLRRSWGGNLPNPDAEIGTDNNSYTSRLNRRRKIRIIMV